MINQELEQYKNYLKQKNRDAVKKTESNYSDEKKKEMKEKRRINAEKYYYNNREIILEKIKQRKMINSDQLVEIKK